MRPDELHTLTEWPDRACLGESLEEFFVADGERWVEARPRITSTAERLCAHCPIRAACREAGKTARWGLWGGVAYYFDGHHVQTREVLRWGGAA